MMNLDSLQRALRPILNRIVALASFGRLTALHSIGQNQRAEVDGGKAGVRSDAQVWWPYGFYARPKKGTPALLLALGGMKGATQVACLTDKHKRPTDWDEEDLGLYCPESGAFVRLCADGRILVDSPGFVGVTSGGGVTVDAQEAVQVTTPAGVSVVAGGDVGAQAGGSLTAVVGGAVNLVAPNGVNITGDLTVAGDVTSTGQVSDLVGTMAAMRGVYNAHTHPHPAAGVTFPPNPPPM